MFISSAYAQSAEQAASASPTLGVILNFVIIFGIFYLLLIRPQMKKAKEYSSMLSGINKGDSIVTGGGIIAKVHKVKDDKAEVDIAENTRVTILLSTIKEVLKDKVELKVSETKADSEKETPVVKEKNKESKNKSSQLKKALEK